MTRDHRRLAAIVSADVAGYSRLMGVDDSGTLAALKAPRRELIDPKMAEYRETWYSATPPFFDLVDKHLAAGLRKAGIPEK